MTSGQQVYSQEFDWRAPVQAFRVLANRPWAHCFHGGDKSKTARWSLIVADPVARLTCKDGQFFRDGAPITGTLTSLMREMSSHTSTQLYQDCDDGALAPFRSGLAGYIGYEAASLFEPTLTLPRSPFALPDLAIGDYDAVAAFDRTTDRLIIHGRSPAAIDRLAQRLRLDQPVLPTSPAAKIQIAKTRCNFSRNDYVEAVKAIGEAILDGDFFQANIARQISMTLENSDQLAVDLFQTLTATTDADHAALLQFDNGTILSNSPERFFQVQPSQQGQLHIKVEPIKGTMRRSSDPDTDQQLALALLASQKDRAENIMIADLLRNDLSRVCTPESVSEDDICALLSLTYVHHLVSRISGTLNVGYDAMDALAALFPCGSITGAPKIEAMKAIARTEGLGRGPYCGTIGYWDDSGGADFSVAIRTMMIERVDQQTQLTLPVGGGITLGSDPQAEYEETALKALGLMSAITSQDSGESAS